MSVELTLHSVSSSNPDGKEMLVFPAVLNSGELQPFSIDTFTSLHHFNYCMFIL